VDLSPEAREVLDRLVPREKQTGDPVRDWVAALDRVWAIREENSHNANVAVKELHKHVSWRRASRLTGKPVTTLVNLGKDPNEVAQEEAAQDPPDGDDT
jgi:hypothetical protein